VQLLSRPGEPIGLDAQSYPAALELFRARRLPAVAVEQGRAAYVMPAIANPTGLAMSPAARAALRSRQLPIIEDDAYADLRFDGAGPAPLLADERARGHTFHVGTFSKTLCPGLRVGWLVVPPRLRRRALRLKAIHDLQSNSLAQAVVDDYLAHHDFDARLVLLRRFYRRRASRLAQAIRRALRGWRFAFPDGGFGLWLEADAVADEVRLLEAAIAEGVSFDAGSQFRRASAAGDPIAMRLCFSLAPPGLFEEGVRRLARAWRRVAGLRAPRRARK
jgi:2-aminoadipate transaminase